jgi:hypothetical protein
MHVNKNWLLLLLSLPVALATRASDEGGNDKLGKLEGVLHGYVTDAVTKKPLPGVTVLATIPGTSNSREVMTDADGYFHFSALPGCQVTVQFDKKGYQSAKRTNITVKEKSPVVLNVEFLPEEVEAGADNSEFPILKLLNAS